MGKGEEKKKSPGDLLAVEPVIFTYAAKDDPETPEAGAAFAFIGLAVAKADFPGGGDD